MTCFATDDGLSIVFNLLFKVLFMRIIQKLGENILEQVLDLIFEKNCLTCKEKTDKANTFCNKCYAGIQFISKPFCIKCAVPLPVTNLGEICQYCQERVPHYDKSFALFRYEDKTKDLIHAIKYEDKTQLVKPLSRMICRLIKDYIEEIDLIIPVPTHKNTLKIRKYNQALLIAREVSKVINKPLDWASLKKIKHIESQIGLKKVERQKNLDGAFLYGGKSLIGKTVLIVDDVMTTGATLDECAKVLKKSGTKKVYNLVIARTFL